MDSGKTSNSPTNLSDALIQKGLINDEQVNRALALQKTVGKPLAVIFVEMNLVTELDIVWTFSNQFKIPYIALDNYLIDPVLFKLIPGHIAKQNLLVPVLRKGDKLTVAMVDPLDVTVIDLIRYITGLTVAPIASTQTDVNYHLQVGYGV